MAGKELDFAGVPRWRKPCQHMQVAAIESKKQVEIIEIGVPQFSAAKIRNVDAVTACNGNGSGIGRISDMPSSCSG